jgi:integrase
VSGHIEPVTRKSGTRYRARWLDPSGKEKCQTFTLKREAQAHLDSVTAAMHTGHYVDPKDQQMTLAQYVTLWTPGQRWSDSSRKQKLSNLRMTVLPRFGDRRMVTILPSEIRAWLNELAETYKPSSVRAHGSLLLQILKSARLDKVIPSNPGEGVKLPAEGKNAIVIPSPEQVAALITAAPGRYRACVWLGVGAGLRQAEMTGLTIDRLHMPLGTPVLGVTRAAKATIAVNQQLARRTGGGLYLKPTTKSEAGMRTLSMPPQVAEALTAHLTAYPATHEWGLLFTTPAGAPLDSSTWSDVWEDITERAGLPDVRFHDLRHYAVSSLIRFSGATPKEIQKFAGHASQQTTYDTYGHLWADSEDRILSGLTDALSAIKVA